MLEEAFLSFLGLGVQPPNSSWGLLAAEGASAITALNSAWWLILFPGLALGVTLFSLELPGGRAARRAGSAAEEPLAEEEEAGARLGAPGGDAREVDPVRCVARVPTLFMMARGHLAQIEAGGLPSRHVDDGGGTDRRRARGDRKLGAARGRRERRSRRAAAAERSPGAGGRE